MTSIAPPLATSERRALAAIVGLGLILHVWGMWWGLPAMPDSWAPDEFSPLRIHTGLVHRFSNGWFELYPPLHVYWLALTLVPIEILIWLGVTELNDPATYAAAFVLIRLVSVGMAAGLVLAVFQVGREVFDARTGLFAALSVAVMPLIVFYAKLANVEVPYLFWFAWSLLFYVRILSHHRMHDYVLLGLTAALTIGTKDQAYGLYLAMPVVIAGSDLASRRRRGDTGPMVQSVFNRRTLAAAAVCALTLVVIHNLLFNWNGAVERVRVITGAMTQQLQEFPNTVPGHIGMVILAGRHLAFALGAPLFVAAIGGLGIAAAHRRRYPRALALLLPIVTYWIFLILPIMYHYDRYLLPVAVILSMFAGLALSRLTGGDKPFRLARHGLVAAALLYTVAVGASVNLLLVKDPRYAAEDWLRGNVARGTKVMAIGYSIYMPRLDHLEVVTCLRPTLDVLADAPEYLVMTSVFEEWRFQDDPEVLAFFQALRAGKTPYEVVFSHRTRPALKLIDWDGVRTNLDKLNPRIRVYRRIRS